MPVTAAEKEDYLGMSDEDFLNINGPATSAAASDDTTNKDLSEAAAAVDPVAVVEEKTAAEIAAAAEDDEDDVVAAVDPAVVVAAADGAVDGKTPDTEVDAEAAALAAKDGKASDKAEVVVDPAATGDNKDAPKADKAAAQVVATPVDHEAFYKQVMTPFKANGREFKLNSPDEAIRLMQMGAGYGRKLQDLQPALKTVKMLEKAGLLDEEKLSFLIDINNKNPEAIKKLIADSGIDPLDLNIGDNVTYAPKNHSVSDKEMTFHSAVDELKAQPAGLETLRVVNQTWDQESKSALWDAPQILGVIQSQRENGIYGQIVTEIDRQKLLGEIPQNTPFLQAYKLAGDRLQANNAFKIADPQPTIQIQSGDTPQPQVIATRTAAPKAQVQNGDKAAAAASTKTTTPRKAGVTVNPLNMADDDFLKTFKDRL